MFPAPPAPSGWDPAALSSANPGAGPGAPAAPLPAIASTSRPTPPPQQQQQKQGGYPAMGVPAAQPLLPAAGKMQQPGWPPMISWEGITLKAPLHIMISDRQVVVPDPTDPLSLYALCRQWVQNEPEATLNRTHDPAPISLPFPIPPVQPPPDVPLPVYMEDFEPYDPEEALRAA